MLQMMFMVHHNNILIEHWNIKIISNYLKLCISQIFLCFQQFQLFPSVWYLENKFNGNFNKYLTFQKFSFNKILFHKQKLCMCRNFHILQNFEIDEMLLIYYNIEYRINFHFITRKALLRKW